MYLMYPLLLEPALRPVLDPHAIIMVQENSRDSSVSGMRLFYDHTTSGDSEVVSLNVVILIAFICCFVFNFVLAFLFVIFEGVRSVPSNHFICALAVSNVLISVHLVLFNNVLEPMKGPSSLCDFAVYGGTTLFFLSNFSRCAIAIDRYIFISDPLRYYQRTQTTFRAFGIGSIFVICVAVIVAPYAFRAREYDAQLLCLPVYPKVYIGIVTVLLTVVPGVLLVVIYTRIFYWAFLQMQILRQEARHFLQKKEAWDEGFLKTPHSSMGSRQLRMYTGAAIMLTPTSPFGSNKHSMDMGIYPEIDVSSNIQTTLHRIVHLLSQMKTRRRVSVTSTSVDNRSGGQPSKVAEKRQGFLQYVGAARNFFQVNKNAAYEERRVSPAPSSHSAVSSQNFKATMRPNHSSPTDRLLGKFWGVSRSPNRPGQNTDGPRTYVPITPEGKWMESKLRNYDVEVVRESMESVPEMGHNIMCKLLKAEVKAAVMIMALMGTFLLCWMPFLIIQTIHIFDIEEVTHFERKAVIFTIILNCALDPMTYALMNPPFRAIVARSVEAICRPYREHYKTPNQQAIKKMAFKIKLKDNTGYETDVDSASISVLKSDGTTL
ncbi:hypothetical protein EGW08_002378 [Elysia chlorotica]|uniref:G-protein coupled receptors family 1 profile domain-containing protein n=1 Tax=Elysia chlorotica TaxID=188477 RepID=A0A3S1AEL2_ELYCH|nr:hypothetical protein EGW08_002378 [Elysia chlorotica]